MVAISSCTVVATSLAALPQAPSRDDPKPPPLDARQIANAGRLTPDEAQALVGFFLPKLPQPAPESDKTIAGLPTDSPTELLTWERVFGLAILRARIGTGRGAPLLDARVFADLAAGRGIGDFGRFRDDFTVARPGARAMLRDPSADYLKLLLSLQIIDDAQCNVARQENCLKLFRELIRGESSGLTQFDLDLVDASLVSARQVLAEETARFRDALEELKVALGFAPGELLIPDRKGIAAFREAFEDIHNWHRNPNRTLEVLAQLIARLPALGEVIVDGRPVLGAVEANPNGLEEALATATRIAKKHRADADKSAIAQDSDPALELRVRRRIRGLVETRRSYNGQKRRYELVCRLIDDLVTQLVAPPAGGTSALAQSARATTGTTALLAQFNQIQRAEDNLVSLWTSFKRERLALYRDLGVLPYDNWKSFYDDLAAQIGPNK
jgi:hypothetical protein